MELLHPDMAILRVEKRLHCRMHKVKEKNGAQKDPFRDAVAVLCLRLYSAGMTLSNYFLYLFPYNPQGSRDKVDTCVEIRYIFLYIMKWAMAFIKRGSGEGLSFGGAFFIFKKEEASMEQYDYEKVMRFVEEEDVRFIRLAYFDVFGVQKNISIMEGQLERAFREGISFDASAVAGFGDEVESDLFLHPDPSTFSIVPWRPSTGRVARMYCDIRYPDGRIYEKDSRYILKEAVEQARTEGIRVDFGTEVEFYLFETDERGSATKIPFDRAGYMDLAPEDKGENIRREICFTLIDMGIEPEASHHEEGPGQNEIDFQYSDALTAADNTATFKWVVSTAAMGNGLYADFSPKPVKEYAGNGMHINMSVKSSDGEDKTGLFMSGILEHIRDITLFLNPSEDSYRRLGEKKAPKYVTWSPENRSQLIRIPAVKNGKKRIELRSPDPTANPYLAFALLIHAGLDGIRRELPLRDPVSVNLYTAGPEVTGGLERLPGSRAEAWECAVGSALVRDVLPAAYLEAYRNLPKTDR